MLKTLPKSYDFALVSDHGFERVDRIANLKAIAAADGITGDLTARGGLAFTNDPKVAAWLRAQSGRGDVGLEIPRDELLKYAPDLNDAVAAFEPAAHVMFGRSERDMPHAVPPEKGDHGFWPLRADYRSVFLLSGSGIRTGNIGPQEMVSLKDRLAAAMGLSCPAR
jgi:predicted AlkP superfamily pyrophosphatase or phosphodiesterase